jgi:hypothetical protein
MFDNTVSCAVLTLLKAYTGIWVICVLSQANTICFHVSAYDLYKNSHYYYYYYYYYMICTFMQKVYGMFVFVDNTEVAKALVITT